MNADRAPARHRQPFLDLTGRHIVVDEDPHEAQAGGS